MRGFLEILKADRHTLVADAYVVEEARLNLEAKFPAALKDFEGLLNQLESSATLRCFPPPELAPGLPIKDRPVLAAAIQPGCQVLWNGDNTHLGPLYGRIFEGMTIHLPASSATHLRS